jgi:hypothetical protein
MHRNIISTFTLLVLTLTPLVGTLSNSAEAAGKGKPDLINETTQTTTTPLTDPLPEFPSSQIYFGTSGKGYPRFASVSAPDSLNKCPLESFPTDLASIVDQLTLKIRNTVAKIKATRGSHCTALANNLNANQTQLSDALKKQIAAPAPANGTTNQSAINAQTQSAGATNQLLLTVTDLVQKDCLSSVDDRVVIQRLVGQVITLGGFFLGGWQGILTAVGGQLIANLPIFTDELDAVLKLFNKYDEQTERGTFLCFYRQMQKTSCSLFSKPHDDIIEGFDLTLGSGPALTTTQSIEEIKRNNPAALHDAIELYGIHKNFEPFLTLMERDESLKDGSIEGIQALRQACILKTPEAFQAEGTHPTSLTDSLRSLIATCEELKLYQWTVPTSSDFARDQGQIFWNALALSDYYEQIRKGETELSTITQTYESLIYFQTLQKNFEEFRDPTTGSQARMNYLTLTEKLGNTLASKSFKRIMRSDWKKLKERSIFRRGQTLALPLRQRALTGMLDLCQTMDPTLACLHVSDPTHTKLHKHWMKRCVGPKSRLCHDVLGVTENDIPLKDLLLTDPAYRIYFDSLCGKAP